MILVYYVLQDPTKKMKNLTPESHETIQREGQLMSTEAG
jgi:hypothetical protein